MFKRPKHDGTLIFESEEDSDFRQKIGFRIGESLLDAALRAGVPLANSCGGMGTCGTCRVWVTGGREHLTERNDVEAEVAHQKKFDEFERLACQMDAREGLELTIPRTR